MKNIFKFIVFIMIMEAVLVCFSGCGMNSARRNKNRTSKNEVVLENGNTKYEKEFGSYEVNAGWIESKTHSSKGKYFYVRDGQDNDKKPNNISINQDTNRYTKSEHEQFKNAIYSQMAKQVSGSKAQIMASGSTTDNGEIVYTFIVEKNASIIKQYYIVGEKKYVMIYETVWNKEDENEVDEVANKMVNSFKWLD